MGNKSDSSSLLRDFRLFCGSEKYVKFLSVINTRAVHLRRLLHWQEKLWFEFCGKNNEYSNIEQSELFEIFRICHIHNEPLLDDEVKAIYAYWRFSKPIFMLLSTCSRSQIWCTAAILSKDNGTATER